MNKRLYGMALAVVVTLRSVGAAQMFTATDLGTLGGTDSSAVAEPHRRHRPWPT